MRSLSESLFDSETQTAMESLFDKDLVEKNLPVFGDLYEPTMIRLAGTRESLGLGKEEGYSRLMSNLNGEKLRRDVKPVDLTGVPGWDKNLDELQYLLAVLNEITIVPSKDSWRPFSEILKDEIKKKLFKYKRGGHWTNNRAFVTMFVDRDGIPYIRLGIGVPDFLYIEIYYKEK